MPKITLYVYSTHSWFFLTMSDKSIQESEFKQTKTSIILTINIYGQQLLLDWYL